GNREMLRFYAIETTPTNTGGKADHRRGMSPSAFYGLSHPEKGGGLAWRLFGPAGDDLQQHRGGSLVIPGDHCPPAIHVLAHQMNAALGNVGKTVFYGDPVDANPVIQSQSIKELVDDLNAGKVDLLVMSGVNPVFDAPADLDFAGAMRKAKLVVHHGLY